MKERELLGCGGGRIPYNKIVRSVPHNTVATKEPPGERTNELAPLQVSQTGQTGQTVGQRPKDVEFWFPSLGDFPIIKEQSTQ